MLHYELSLRINLIFVDFLKMFKVYLLNIYICVCMYLL